MCFSDSVNGYGQDNMFGGISKTTNAGISWVGTVDGPGRWMNAIAARGQSATSVGEYGGIWRTNDGGGSIVRNVTVAPHHLDFGDITLGYPITDSVRITNGGVDTLQVTTDGDFPNRISVAPGTSRFLKIYFYSARDTGVHVGATHLWANADLLGDSITWTYRSVGPVLGFNPNYLDFGTVRPGDTVARTLFISNDGNALLRFWQAEVLNAQSQHDTRFVVDPTNDSVSAGDSVRVVVTFYPDAAPLGNCLFHFSQTNGQGAMTVLANVVGVREDRAAPGALQLEPAYPNPFTQTTALAFSVASSQHVDLSILTIDGRVVETFLDAQVDAGRHTLEWPSRKVPSGVYVCRLNTAAGVVARILIKSE